MQHTGSSAELLKTDFKLDKMEETEVLRYAGRPAGTVIEVEEGAEQ